MLNILPKPGYYIELFKDPLTCGRQMLPQKNDPRSVHWYAVVDSPRQKDSLRAGLKDSDCSLASCLGSPILCLRAILQQTGYERGGEATSYTFYCIYTSPFLFPPTKVILLTDRKVTQLGFSAQLNIIWPSVYSTLYTLYRHLWPLRSDFKLSPAS